MIEQLQSDFLFWIFIYFLIVGLLIRNIHLTRKIKSIEKNKMFPAEEYAVLWICPYISRHLLSLNPLLACCRRYSRGER